MKWKLEFPEAKVLVYYFSKLTGLAPFVVKEDRFRPPTLLGKIYSLSLAITYFLALQIALTPVIAKGGPGNFSQLGNIGITIRHLMNTASMFLTLIIFSFTYKEILYILNKLCSISDELIGLGVDEDRGKMFKNIFATVLTTNAVVFGICVMSTFVYPYWPILFSTKYAIDSCFKLNAILIFTQTLLFVRQRFSMLNERLFSLFRPPGLDNSPIFLVSRIFREQTQVRIEGPTDLQRLRTIEILHLDLCDLLDRITRLFSISLLTLSLLYTTEMMLICYRLYFVFRDNTGEIVTLLMHILGPAIGIVITSVPSFMIAHASVTTCREGNATRTLLSKVRDEHRSPDLESEFSMFTLQLLRTPAVLSVFGFFDLDYSYIYKIFCAVAAYLIVMIQFDMSQPNRGA